MPTVTFSNASGSVAYKTVGVLGERWASLLGSKARHPAQLHWNHHMGYAEDYQAVEMRWAEILRLAASLGLEMSNQPDQACINVAHRTFVDAFRRLGPRTPKEWFELNVALHWHEHHLQGRGPATALDYNLGDWVGIPIPEGCTPEAIVDGGCYLLFAQIGRWWEEAWRASDTGLPASQHTQQSIWNASCYLANHTLAEDSAREEALFGSRDWGCTIAQRQRGKYKVANRISNMPVDWNLYPVSRVNVT